LEITGSIENKRSFYKIITLISKLFFFSIRKICQLVPNYSEKVAVISLHRLGDSVFTIPAIRQIQNYYKRKITIVCFPDTVPIYKIGLTNVEYCVLKPDDFYFAKRVAGFKNRKVFRNVKPEIIFDLTGVMSSATLIFTSRAKEIIGMNREHFKSIFDSYIPIRNRAHQMDVYLDAISLKIPLNERDHLKQFSINFNRQGRILIHPLAGWRAKQWGARKYIELALILSRNYNVSFIVPENSSFADMNFRDDFSNLNFIRTRSINELIEELKNCSVLIGNDSGPVQIASLLGKPTFTIYGSTNPEFHIPNGEFHSFAQEILECSPSKNDKLCFTHGGLYDCPSFECMEKLSVESVVINLNKLLDKVYN
jgi:heptosyltransferase-2